MLDYTDAAVQISTEGYMSSGQSLQPVEAIFEDKFRALSFIC
jgi:hypothetical protein